MMGTLRIAVATYDRLEATKQCLESIHEKTDCEYKLTVVDNGSQQDTVDYLMEMYSNQLIDDLYLFGKNMGVACAYNLALSFSSEDFIVRLDNDIIIINPDWANVMIDFLSTYKEIATIGFHVWKNCPNESVAGLSDHVAFIARSYTTGACCMFRRDVHERLGYWCEDYGLYGEEDKDFGIRVYEAGMTAGYIDKKEKYLIHEHIPHFSNNIEGLRCNNNRIKSLRMFLLNQILYKNKKRDIHVARKFDYALDGLNVSAKLNKHYSTFIKEIHKLGIELEPILKEQLREKYNLTY